MIESPPPPESLAQRWLAAVSPLFDRERWSQGRWHARVGRVVALDVSPGLVRARLEGGRAVPRRVTLHLEPLDSPAQRRALDVLASQAQFGAALVSGHVPASLHGALAAAGVSLVPTARDSVRLSCTCSDSRKQPCKHEAAVCFALADRLDADPLTLFTLRGLERDQLLAILRVRRAAPPAPAWFDSPAFDLILAAAHGAITRHATGLLAALDDGETEPSRSSSTP